jgi:hypothetical protein
MTRIPCANSSGCVVLYEGDNGMTWHLNAEDGLGQEVWHLALPPALLRDLGANIVQLLDALNARGLGLAVEGRNDRDQQLAAQRRADDDAMRRARGGL